CRAPRQAWAPRARCRACEGEGLIVTVTRASFLESHPQFANCATTLLDAKLAESERRHGDAWGDLRDDAVSYYAAHLISLDPRAEGSAMSQPSNGAAHYSASVYLREYERLAAVARADMFGTVGGC